MLKTLTSLDLGCVQIEVVSDAVQVTYAEDEKFWSGLPRASC
jgi:hypothetical protein